MCNPHVPAVLAQAWIWCDVVDGARLDAGKRLLRLARARSKYRVRKRQPLDRKLGSRRRWRVERHKRVRRTCRAVTA